MITKFRQQTQNLDTEASIAMDVTQNTQWSSFM